MRPAVLVFRLLYERLLKVKGLSLPFQPEVAYLEAFATYAMEVMDYQLECLRLPLKGGQTTAFYGWVTYQMLWENDAFRKRAKTRQERDGDSSLMAMVDDIAGRREQYARLVNLLAAFAFYSGLGMYTGQGMGMVRKVERDER